MAGRTKKRPCMPLAETLDSREESIDIEEVNQPPHQTQAARGPDVHNDSDDGQSEIEEIDEDDFPPITKEQQALDEQELEKAHDMYTAQRSQCYAAYNPPYISEQRDKNKRRMLAYPCKTCERPMYDTSPTNLSKHVASCLKKQKDVEDSQKLAALGVSGTGDINPRDVPQLCAIWCAEGAQPFSALGEAAQPPPSKEANPLPKPQTGVLAQLSGASEARAGNNLTDPLNMWLAGGLHLNEEGLPVNLLKWWIQQARGGNTHGGLLHMALDVLSCPATTVDVKRAFSFGRDYVSFKRHRLSASSVTRGMTIAFYPKSGKIKPGTWRKWKENQKNEQKKKTKGKSRDK
ncbi:hypothetical protein PSTG_16483 [Puccinia striiformis f. sp. tritici PST-78]|uniref:HAT C-terminal dimerisation domain-containing protein n=1 Tax=Puccinia striiformis f. sp. tritici PST-78 TaxID=1165861 RepID=A0A0L0USQ1_9BASI|nr:hypothetical protein PSTG_16483 [Puccinia striiformis f. sp. tritici PST-78]